MGCWEKRKHLNYYKVVQGILDDYKGNAILDVGGWDTPIVLSGEFHHRTVVNTYKVEQPLEGVNYHIEDFLTWEPDTSYDVVTCLQVLEHQEDDSVFDFTQKLFAVGKTVIISVPYKWKQNANATHPQDPVDETKLKSWTGREPSRAELVTDGKVQRLIAVYESQDAKLTLPPGIWDNPDPGDIEAYDAFVQAWYGNVSSASVSGKQISGGLVEAQAGYDYDCSNEYTECSSTGESIGTYGSYQIAQATDDKGFEVFQNAECSIRPTTPDLAVGYTVVFDGGSDYRRSMFLRFDTNIPQGVTIRSAKITGNLVGYGGGQAKIVWIAMEDSTNSSGFAVDNLTSGAQARDRVRTENAILWDMGAFPTDFVTPDLSCLLQGVVDKVGFGGNITFFIEWAGDTSNTNHVEIKEFDDFPGQAAILEVYWTQPPLPLITMSGSGIELGGSAGLVNRDFMTGGVEVGGVAGTPLGTLDMIGGVEVGADVPAPLPLTTTMSGGIEAGGDAIEKTIIGMDGGLEVGLKGGYSNGYNLRNTITVEQQNTKKWQFPVRIHALMPDTFTSDFQFEDTTGRVLPHKTSFLTASDDGVELFCVVMVDLDDEAATSFYLYWG